MQYYQTYIHTVCLSVCLFDLEKVRYIRLMWWFCTAGGDAAADDSEDEDVHAVCEDLDYAEGRVTQLRYVYELIPELRTQLIAKEILTRK